MTCGQRWYSVNREVFGRKRGAMVNWVSDVITTLNSQALEEKTKMTWAACIGASYRHPWSSSECAASNVLAPEVILVQVIKNCSAVLWLSEQPLASRMVYTSKQEKPSRAAGRRLVWGLWFIQYTSKARGRGLRARRPWSVCSLAYLFHTLPCKSTGWRLHRDVKYDLFQIEIIQCLTCNFSTAVGSGSLIYVNQQQPLDQNIDFHGNKEFWMWPAN